MPLDLPHPLPALIVALVGATAGLIAWRRRVALAPTALALIGAALLCAALAAGGVRVLSGDRTPVTVMVDLSPSTRGALYRDPQTLRRRLGELLGDRAYRLLFFAEQNVASVAADLPDLPGRRTIYDPPPDAPAVVLFGDGRFAAPAFAPPTYPVLDGGLLDPPDGAVRDLRIDGGRVSAELAVGAAGRSVQFAGTVPQVPLPLSPPGQWLSAPIDPAAALVSATIVPGDRWPENDAMRLDVLPTGAVPWWVGDGAAPDGWRRFAPADLPVDAAAYLGASAIVLKNVSAGALSPMALQRLGQYVRDLGGALLLVGGDRAFAAGGYATSVLDDLSPLASAPPRPTVHWVLLTDASGSMDEPAGAGSRWGQAIAALRRACAALPPEDLVSVGGFARDLRWWVDRRTVREARHLALPPPDAHPSGPTNLRAALTDLAALNPAGLRTQALLLTDAQGSLDDPLALARQLTAADIHLHVLLIGDGPAAGALRQIAGATGGSMRTVLDAARWSDAAGEMLRTAIPDRLHVAPTTVIWRAELGALPPLTVAPWNRVWLKPGATLLGETTLDDQALPLAASWRTGLGTVMALAYAAPAEQAAAQAQRIARPPADPRFTVERIAEGGGWRIVARVPPPWTDEPRKVSLWDGSAELAPARVAPGEYEATVPSSTEPRLVRATFDGAGERWVALPGSYAPEFAAVGLDVAALSALADRTGGMVVSPTRRAPIVLPRSTHFRSIAPLLCGAAVVFLGIALLVWRRGSRE